MADNLVTECLGILRNHKKIIHYSFEFFSNRSDVTWNSSESLSNSLEMLQNLWNFEGTFKHATKSA